MNSNLFPTVVVIAFLSCPALVGQSCADDPSTAFNDRLTIELDALEDFFTPTSPTDEQIQRTERFMANVKRSLCEGLTSNQIESSTQAVKGLQVLKASNSVCDLDTGGAREDRFLPSDFGVFFELMLHSATSFCSELGELRERYEGLRVYFLVDSIKAHEKYQEESMCARSDFFESLADSFFFPEVLRDFPRDVEFRSTLALLCDQVKSRDIEFEAAEREFQRALIRMRFGGERQRMLAVTFHVLTKFFGRLLLWPVLGVLMLSVLSFALSVPGFIIFRMLSWVNPTRYVWDDFVELFQMGMSIPFGVVVVLCTVVFLISATGLKFLEVLALLAGIVGTVIGAIVGLKKLAQRSGGN